MNAKETQFKLAETVTVRNSARVPLHDFKKPAEIFSFYGLEDREEHIVVALGEWEDVDLPLVRLHSECLTGDVFHSQKCDCGDYDCCFFHPFKF